MKCIVLQVNPYKFVNDGGEVVEGVNCFYIYAEDLKPVEGVNGAKGVPILKQSFPLSKLPAFSHAPALYDFVFESRPVNGKLTFIPVDVKYVSDIVSTVGK